MRRLAWLILAALLAWSISAWPVAAASGGHSVPTYTYDGHHHSALPTYNTHDRGPPGTYDHATAYDPVDHWSHGASTHPEGATIPAAETYNDLAEAVQVVMTAVATSEVTRGIQRNPGLATRRHVAAKGADEAGALVRYDPEFASRNLLGQVGEGYARTPSGYTVSAHAAKRIVYGAPGRSPTTLSRVDDILNNPTRSVMRPDGSIRVFQGKDWVAVRGSGPIHIITVMVR